MSLTRAVRSPRALAAWFPALVAITAVGGSSALAADPRPPAYAIGAQVADFEATDTDGKAFSLAAARAVSAEQAHAAVLAAAKERGATDAAKPADPIDGLPGLKKGDALDADARLAFVRAVGRPYGLMPDAKAAVGFATLGDLEKWVADAAKAPIVLVFWSPKCPAVKLYRDRVDALFAETGARLYLVASNHTDALADLKAAADAEGYRVLVDADARVADLFAAKRTPHAFVLDPKDVLRYSGAIDDDPTGQAGATALWLKDAVVAARDGKATDVLMTAPKG